MSISVYIIPSTLEGTSWQLKFNYIMFFSPEVLIYIFGKNAACGQQSTLSHLYEIQSKIVNRVKTVKNSLKPSKLVKNG